MNTLYNNEAEIEVVVRGFESCKTGKGEFKHRDHLTVALWYLSVTSLEETIDRMRTGLLRFLDHHGVKGMKWGIRNEKKKSSSGGSKGGSGRSSAKDLSDEQLQKAIARMDLEKRYSELSSPPKKNKAGKAFASELGKNLVKTAVMAAGTHAVNQALKKK